MKRFGVPALTEQDVLTRKVARLARIGIPDDAKPEVNAARLERFGAVDPADLKRKHFSKKRDKKFLN